MDSKKKLERTDYNIEYAHIYTSEKFGLQHKKSIEILKDTIKKLKRLKKSYVLSLLIDDYNPSNPILNIKEFLADLKKFDANPDFICFESKLVRDYEVLLKEIEGPLRKEYIKYIGKHKKIPCSFLIAVWHLKRLGLLRISKEELNYLGRNPQKTFVAKKVITILPRKYQKLEMRGLEIIASTRFKKYIDDILDIFF